MPANGPCLLSTTPARRNGVATLCGWKKYPGSGKTSKIANPPRTAVFPSPRGSQAKPNRGSKLRVVGLEKNEEATPAQPGFPNTVVRAGFAVPHGEKGPLRGGRLFIGPCPSFAPFVIS